MAPLPSFSPAMRHPKFTHSRDTMVNEQDYVELSCADTRRALEWKEAERPQRIRVRCDKSTDDVSLIGDTV